MNVLIITANAIVELGEKHTTAKKYCDRFLMTMRFADINKPDDFLKAFRGNLISGKVSLIKGQQAITVNRIVFDLGGNGKNSFRVICHYQIGKNFARLYINLSSIIKLVQIALKKVRFEQRKRSNNGLFQVFYVKKIAFFKVTQVLHYS